MHTQGRRVTHSRRVQPHAESQAGAAEEMEGATHVLPGHMPALVIEDFGLERNLDRVGGMGETNVTVMLFEKCGLCQDSITHPDMSQAGKISHFPPTRP